MRRDEAQLQPGDPPQQLEPEHHPHVPPEQNELEYRNADEGVPAACQRQLNVLSARPRVPGRGVQGQLTSPQPQPQRIDHAQERRLQHDRVTRAHREANRLVEGRQVFGRNDSPIDELANQRADAIVNEDFSSDEQRQGDQKPDVSLDIVEKGDSDPAVKVAINRRQQQER